MDAKNDSNGLEVEYRRVQDAQQARKGRIRKGRERTYARKREIIEGMNVTIKPYAHAFPPSLLFDERYMELFLDVKEDTRGLPYREARERIERSVGTGIGERMFSAIIPSIQELLPHIRHSVYHVVDPIILFMLYIELHGSKRTQYAREIDRIIITKSYRHLQYKTQIMINSASDDQRTRLLHSLEVQRIAKTLAMQTGANWELAQAIAVGHDVGHAPFGHAGERALNRCLEDDFHGGFSHALQSVKVLNALEEHPIMQKYGLNGLGLSIEVLSGILKHDTDVFTDNIAKPAFRLQYNCPEVVAYVPKDHHKSDDAMRMNAGDVAANAVTMGGIEAQIVFWADKLAYLGHDWEEFASSEMMEQMLRTMNNIVGKIAQINHQYDKDDGDRELRLIKRIHRSISKMNKLYSEEEGPDNGEPASKTDVDDQKERLKLLVYIDDLLNKNNPAHDRDQRLSFRCTRLSYPEFAMLFSYFDVARAWMVITDRIPEKYKDSNDIIYIIYNFFKETLSQRITPSILDELIDETTKNTDVVALDEHKFVEISERRWEEEQRRIEASRREEAEAGKLAQRSSASADVKKRFRRALLVTLSEETAKEVDLVNDFVMEYYISSTTVQNMTNKAEMIIKGLYKYYMDNPEMLPDKQLNRYCTEVETDDNAHERLMVAYLWDKLHEFKFAKKMEKQPLSGELDKAWEMLVKKTRECADLLANERQRSTTDMDSVQTSGQSKDRQMDKRSSTSQHERVLFKAFEKIVNGRGKITGKPFDTRRNKYLFRNHGVDGPASIITRPHALHLNRTKLARVVADYIADMTDRMAVMKYDEVYSSKSTWSVMYHE